MLSPRDWIERVRRGRRPQEAAPAPVMRPAALPGVFELPADVRDVLLDLERRGELRRALELPPDRAALASHLADLVAEHGRDAFRDALRVIDLGDELGHDGEAVAMPPGTPDPASAAACPSTALAGSGSGNPVAATEPSALPAEAVAQLANLNVNQWRDTRNTDGWYGPDAQGRYELFLQRAAVGPRLFKELASRGIVRKEAHGVAASAAMTFAIQAGKYPFRTVLALDLEKLKVVTGASFEAIHAQWDAAERRYAVTVVRGEAPAARRDEVAHEPVT